MPALRIWVQEVYDPIFQDCYSRRMNDYAISVEFEQKGYRVSRWMVEQRRRQLDLPSHGNVHYAQDRPFKSRPDPLAIAQQWVPGFNREKMTLDGKPTSTQAVMLLCNARLKKEGIPMITVNEQWIPR